MCIFLCLCYVLACCFVQIYYFPFILEEHIAMSRPEKELFDADLERLLTLVCAFFTRKRRKTLKHLRGKNFKVTYACNQRGQTSKQISE